MFKLLTLLLCFCWLATPACPAKHHKQPTAASQAVQQKQADDGSGAVADSASTPDKSPSDVNKTLDKILSSPLHSCSQAAAGPPGSQLQDGDLPEAKASNSADQSAAASQATSTLKGQASIDAASTQTGTVDSSDNLRLQRPTPVLQGQASMNGAHLQADKDDPDAGDQQLMVEWDRWRNRFLRAVQMQVQANINNPDAPMRRRRRFDPYTGGLSLPYPLGTITWFRCRITADRKIAELDIVESSGFPDYDRAVISGIHALEGTSLLEFPSGSRRLSVGQAAGIETAARPESPYFNFGDIERYSVPMQRSGY